MLRNHNHIYICTTINVECSLQDLIKELTIVSIGGLCDNISRKFKRAFETSIGSLEFPKMCFFWVLFLMRPYKLPNHKVLIPNLPWIFDKI